MSNPRIAVSQLKQLIQLRSNGLSTRDIGRALSRSQGAVSKYCRAVLTACGTWEAALALEESELEGRVFAARRQFLRSGLRIATLLTVACKSCAAVIRASPQAGIHVRINRRKFSRRTRKLWHC